MQSAIEKTKPIRLLILDVDGVLTSGTIYVGMQGTEMKGFHIHDGLGIRLMQKAGIEMAVISGHYSEAVAERLRYLDVKHVYLGHDKKLPAYDELKQTLSLNDHEIAYMGDDLPDLPLLTRVGLAMTVTQAPEIIKKHAHFVSTKKGGKGAVREACEFILEGKGQLQTVFDAYLT